MHTSSSGGSSDTEVKLLTVSPAGSPVRVEAGHDRHSGREAAERIAQGARIVPAAIFASSGWSAMGYPYTGPESRRLEAVKTSSRAGVRASTSATVRL